jgi:hypothetical protein
MPWLPPEIAMNDESGAHELDSLMLGANFAYVFFRDRAAVDRARLAIRQRLAHAAPSRVARRADDVASTRSRPRPRATKSR